MACGDGKCPEYIVNAILKRVEVGKIGRTLQTRLAFAQFKVEHGLEDLPFDTIEPRMKKLQDANDHSSSSSSEILSSSSSPCEGDGNCYGNRRCLVESLGKSSTVFSDQLHLMKIIRDSPSLRKRHCNPSPEDGNYRVYSWKRHCSSPLISHITPAPNRNQALSSPVMNRKQHQYHHFTSDSGPIPPLYSDSCRKNMMCSPCMAEIDKEDGDLPQHHPSDIRSSPPPLPCTPPPRRHCLNCHHHHHHHLSVEKRGNDNGKDAHSLTNLDLSTSPSFRKTPGLIQHPSSTPPPPQTPTLPSSVMSTSRGTYDIFSSDTGPHTPLQAFDFSDFVNITPSPSRPAWPVTSQIRISSKNVN